MGLIKGIPVTLLGRRKTGEDPFGQDLYEEYEIQVENVLVAPSRSEDVTHQLSVTGKMVVYDLGIPKGDTNDWENRVVVFFGKRWRTVGVPLEGIEAMVPLDWNRKVRVERYE